MKAKNIKFIIWDSLLQLIKQQRLRISNFLFTFLRTLEAYFLSLQWIYLLSVLENLI